MRRMILLRLGATASQEVHGLTLRALLRIVLLDVLTACHHKIWRSMVRTIFPALLWGCAVDA